MSQFVRLNVDALNDVTPALFNKMIQGLTMKAGVKLSLNTKKHDIYVGNAIGRKREDDVDCVLQENGKDTTLGFKFVKNAKNGKYSLSVRGDFWGTGYHEQDFCNTLAQNYIATKVLNDTRVNGQTVVSNKVKANGDIVIRVTA